MKKIILAIAIAAVASMSVAAFASADVARYQPMTATLVASVTEVSGNHHTFTITVNPCDGSFTGTGQGDAVAGSAHETITGTLVGDQLTFSAVYTDFIPGYTWTYNGPLSGVALGGNATGYHATATVTPITGTPTYKNHGDYVSQNTDKADAAHSCIGMPIQ